MWRHSAWRERVFLTQPRGCVADWALVRPMEGSPSVEPVWLGGFSAFFSVLDFGEGRSMACAKTYRVCVCVCDVGV